MLAMLGRLWGSPVVYRGRDVEVRDRGGIRTLHLGTDTVQSAMRLDQPDELELSYTRAMMGFLLFNAEPENAILIGLGGGSLAKFIYRRLPRTKVRVVEINAEVIDVARRFFATPEDDRRLSVICAEGAAHVARTHGAADVLLIDAYDGRSLAADLATEGFFESARAALTPTGVFVMNLWSNDRAFDTNLRRIEQAFGYRCLCLPAERPGNIVVFAFNEPPRSLRWIELLEHAEALHARLGLEFVRFVQGLKQMNRYDATGINIGDSS